MSEYTDGLSWWDDIAQVLANDIARKLAKIEENARESGDQMTISVYNPPNASVLRKWR